MGDGLDSLALRCVAAEREIDQLRARLAEVERERDEERFRAKETGDACEALELECTRERDAAIARAERAEAELERLRAVVEAARVLISRAYPMVLDNEYHVGWRDLEDLRAALDALDAGAQCPSS